MDRIEPPTESVSPPPSATRGEGPPSCPYCSRPFPSERLRTLHLGLEHDERLTERQRAAFEAAYLAEEAELRRFRLWVLAALVLVYFCLLFVYAVVT